MNPEESTEGKELATVKKPVRWWRRLGIGVLFLAASALAFALGYFGVWAWQRYFPAALGPIVNLYEDWQVYKSETYALGLRYPEGWEALEVNPAFVIFRVKAKEGEAVLKDYVSLTISSNATRGKTACEDDRSKCSFSANDIFGERFSSPEEEVIFFSKDTNDFTLKWHRYGEVDFAEFFEEMGKSLRFTTLEQSDAKNP